MRAEDRMEEVVRSLCEGGIQVSVSALPSSIVGSSATPPVVSHRGGASAHPSRPPTVASPKVGAFSATRPPAKEEGKTQIPARDGVGETASNDTKTSRDEAARILEDFLLDTRERGQHNLQRAGGRGGELGEPGGSLDKPENITETAKVIILERNEFQPGEGSVGGGGAERDNTSLSSCLFFIEQATLVSGGVYTLRTAGCWLRDHTLLLRQPLVPEIRSLRGAPVAVVIIKNFFEAIRVGPRRAYLVGYLGKLINALAETLDFHYNILEGTSFGVKSSNGSYDGVIGHIEREEGEIGLASLSITHRRYQAIDFTTWLRFQPSLFVTRGPRYLKDPMAVFRPYSWQVTDTPFPPSSFSHTPSLAFSDMT
ncbi:hypothetical protein O3P69_004530 [Scylla paramamosain]|uniref:Ionotropic glutamate receptor L-glutamate and glycine-binding domain-containing protein n=1 Tax=Scylla paramamosain TaxID=85552 RepID=A0AAW0UER4_SCYPA